MQTNLLPMIAVKLTAEPLWLTSNWLMPEFLRLSLIHVHSLCYPKTAYPFSQLSFWCFVHIFFHKLWRPKQHKCWQISNRQLSFLELNASFFLFDVYEKKTRRPASCTAVSKTHCKIWVCFFLLCRRQSVIGLFLTSASEQPHQKWWNENDFYQESDHALFDIRVCSFIYSSP